jgi:hypothetical protein
MHGYETLTAAADAAAPPSVEPDGLGSAAPARQGDFAAGLRAPAHAAAAHGTFATGVSEPLTPPARTTGDFASGTRSTAGPRVVGDFASGMRARDNGQVRADAADTARSDRRRELDWARA